MKDAPFPPLPHLREDERISRASAAYARLATRRTCRAFTDTPVPREVIESAIRAAATAPSGALRKKPLEQIASWL